MDYTVSKRGELAKLYVQMGYKIGAEIGVADGRFSECICQAYPEGAPPKLYCIDPWDSYDENSRGGGKDQQYGNLEKAHNRLDKYGAIFLRKMSMDAVKEFDDNSLDFVYIDANHDFDYVMEDIIHWSRKVRPGGMISGHDYYHFQNSGVIEAVDCYISAHGIRQWGITQEREPSFYWIKPEKEIRKHVKKYV